MTAVRPTPGEPVPAAQARGGSESSAATGPSSGPGLPTLSSPETGAAPAPAWAVRALPGRAQLQRFQRALEALVDSRGSLRAIALMRMLMGAVVIRHLWPYLGAAVLPVERFHVPWWSWLPVPPPAAYRALLWLGVAAGGAMILGVATRLATKAAFAVVAYLLFVDMTGFVQNRAFLVWLLFGLSLLPTGGAFSLIRVFRRGDGACVGPVWPVFLLQVVVSGVYLTSGFTKLVDPDWSGGLVLWDRVVRYSDLIPFDGWIFDLLTNRDFYRVLAPSAIAVELFVAIGLWLPRTRLTAIWLAILFHLSIEVTASVQTFSYSAMAALLLWVVPATRDRVLLATPRLHNLVRRLDWLQRFSLDPPVSSNGSATVLMDRDGTVRRARDAELTALSRLPVLFPLIAPVLAVHRLRRRHASGLIPEADDGAKSARAGVT